MVSRRVAASTRMASTETRRRSSDLMRRVVFIGTLSIAWPRVHRPDHGVRRPRRLTVLVRFVSNSFEKAYKGQFREFSEHPSRKWICQFVAPRIVVCAVILKNEITTTTI